MTQQLALWIIWAAAPPATLVPILYGFTARWWASLSGRALMTSALGLALLIDLSLMFRSWEGHVDLKQRIALVVYALICVGAWLMLFSLIRVQWRALRGRRTP
jgi:hypothetical protein